MPRCHAYSFCRRYELRALTSKFCRYPQLLNNFPFNGRARMFSRFDVTTRGQPKPRLYVIDKQNLITIDEEKIRNQMFGRCCRFFDAEEFIATVYPFKSIGKHGLFEVIKRYDARNFIADALAQDSCIFQHQQALGFELDMVVVYFFLADFYRTNTHKISRTEWHPGKIFSDVGLVFVKLLMALDWVMDQLHEHEDN